jgi:adenylosuccinate synthase
VSQYAVIGAGFGDEGKGKIVSSLCSQSSGPLVVRFCGGQQAGHHVVLGNGFDHVFSNFGSGTAQGVPTYWSKFCTFDPVGEVNERECLATKHVIPTLFIDENCPVTTPYDKVANRRDNSFNGHGSCGVGVGRTWQREADHFSLLAGDLRFPSVLEAKLELIRGQYYAAELCEYDVEPFLDACRKVYETCHIVGSLAECGNYSDVIFEGSQGLLLDQNFGFFPHVTRSNTGTKNVLELSSNPGLIRRIYVTRAYQTRHGNGPMTNQALLHKIKINPYEQNPDNSFQGEFRRSLLDLDLLEYALCRDGNHPASLAVTCLDLVQEDFSLTHRGVARTFADEEKFLSYISSKLNREVKYKSRVPTP